MRHRSVRYQNGVLWLTAVILAAASCGDDETERRDGTDADGDGWALPADCRDDDPLVFPGADETPYDGVDQDCSGSDLTDVDRDGFDLAGGRDTGAAGAHGVAGAAGAGPGQGDGDCDDTRADVNPAAVDVCGDGIDQDCSGSDQACDALDRDGDGVSGADGDCNDLDPAVSPEAAERYYNGIDDDCDATTDDADQDGDGFSLTSGGDCDDQDAAIFPGADEIAYDGVDQDCSGGDMLDLDGDGVAGGPEGEDCDDLDASVRPGRDEIVVDGIDQNCDGSDLAGVDEFRALASPEAVPADVPAIAVGHDDPSVPLALLAWADSRVAPRQDVYARALDSAGAPLGDEVEVASGGLEKFNVLVASAGDGFLVTWETTDGLFGRLLDAAGPVAAATQIAPAGATGSDTAFGGGNYAVVWRQADAVPSELRVRMLSPEGVKADNLLIVADAAADQVAIAGRSGDLISVWSAAGIQGQALDGLGEPVGERFTVIQDPSFDAPSIAAGDDGYLVAFRRRFAPYAVHGLTIGADGSRASERRRLSDDSSFVERLSTTATKGGYFVAWSDDRHMVSPPAYPAIYGSSLGPAGELTLRDVALHVEYAAELGGLALLGDSVVVTSQNQAGSGALMFAP